jgi:hypothetical protein
MMDEREVRLTAYIHNLHALICKHIRMRMHVLKHSNTYFNGCKIIGHTLAFYFVQHCVFRIRSFLLYLFVIITAKSVIRVFLRSHGREYEDDCLLGCCAV